MAFSIKEYCALWIKSSRHLCQHPDHLVEAVGKPFGKGSARAKLTALDVNTVAMGIEAKGRTITTQVSSRAMDYNGTQTYRLQCAELLPPDLL